MAKASVVVFGTGEQADVAHFYLTHDSPYEITAFTVDAKYLEASSFKGLPVLPFEEIPSKFPPAANAIFVAIGYKGVNALRTEKYLAAKAIGYKLISYVSSKATVWPGFRVGENCFILEDNTIQPFVTIGNNVTLWSGNHVGHHSTIGDHCFVTSHVVISGGVNIGEACFIGVNATIRDHVKLGKACVIGAGSLILQDAADFSVYSQPGAQLSRVPSFRLRKL